MGIAYQIVDDLLGVFGTEAETGKTTIGDLREGKRTVLIAYATSAPGLGRRSRRCSASPTSTEDGRRAPARAPRSTCGAKSFAEGLARYYANRALARLVEPHIPAALRAELHPVADAVLGTRQVTRDGGAARSHASRSTPRSPSRRRALVIRRYSTSFGMASRLLGAGGAAARSRTSTRWCGSPTRSSTAGPTRRASSARWRRRLLERARARRRARHRRGLQRQPRRARVRPHRPRGRVRHRADRAVLRHHAHGPVADRARRRRASARYVYGSAEVVGLMCLRVFVHDADATTRRASSRRSSAGRGRSAPRSRRSTSCATCAADVEALGRSYFPGIDVGDARPTRRSSRCVDDIDADLARRRRDAPAAARAARAARSRSRTACSRS